ncbi:SDR family oxidoreductase [Streptomyces sp. NPDC048179]|uniref:SDR family oxidoreductase n=1 Tax=Streptomyces sp. NPDC048179 TaxID=3365506 RepID=UPI00371CBE2F
MRIFLTGASGHIGSAVMAELLDAGHQVLGLARSDSSSAVIKAAGAEVRRGDLRDLDVLAEASAAADGVIHLAFDSLDGDLASSLEVEQRTIDTIGEVLEGSGKPLVSTTASLTLSFGGITGRPATEEDVLPGGPRVDSENAVIALAGRGVRSSVVRLPPLVHSELDRSGLFPQLIGIARAHGVSGYIGDGMNRWPAVHTRDAARLYRLALESAPAGSRLHAVAEDGLPFRKLADIIAEGLDVKTVSIPPAAAGRHFSYLAMFVPLDNPISSERTRRLLSWEPAHPALIEDLGQGFYFEH